MNQYGHICYSTSVSWTNLDGEVFVFNELNGDVFVFRGIAKEIWLCIDEYHNLRQILENLKYKHMIEEYSCIKKLKLWSQKKLIEWDGTHEEQVVI